MEKKDETESFRTGKNVAVQRPTTVASSAPILATVFEELEAFQQPPLQRPMTQRSLSSYLTQMDFSAFDKEDESWLLKRLPVLEWVPKYDREWLTPDIIAGLSVGLMMVPQSIAHAAIASVSPMLGLYTGLFGGIIYPTFASCKHLAVGTGAVVALLTGGELDILEASYPDLDRDMAAVHFCFFVGFWQIILGTFGLGYICSFMSSPVMNGSLCGAAFVIMSTQLKHLIGVDYGRSPYFFETVFLFLTHLRNTKWLAISISIISLVLLVLLRNSKRVLKSGEVFLGIQPNTTSAKIITVCADFSAVVISCIGMGIGLLISWNDREDLTPLVGKLPAGILEVSNPFNFNGISVGDLIVPAFVMSLISFVLAIALAKKLGQMYHYPVEASQELIALGLAGLGGSFFKCFPMQSSLSRTMVNVQAGAKTSVAAWVAAIMVFLGILVLKPVLYYLPKASLAAIIEIAALKLVDFEMPKWLFHMYGDWASKLRSDWAVWMAAFVTTLSVGVVYGITLGLALSCLLLIERSTKPKYAILGRLPGSNIYRSVDNFPEALIDKSVLVVRFDASLHFANSQYFKDLLNQIERSVIKIVKEGSEKSTLRGIVVDMGSVNEVDATGVQVLKEMLIEFKKRETRLILANMKGTVRSVIKRSNLDDILAQDDVLMELHEAVESLCPKHLEDEEFEFNDGAFSLPLTGNSIRRTESALSIKDENVHKTIIQALSRRAIERSPMNTPIKINYENNQINHKKSNNILLESSCSSSFEEQPDYNEEESKAEVQI